MPTPLVEHGFDTVKSLTYTSIVQVGAIPGALLAYPIVDRWQRKYLIGVLYVTIAALAVVYGYAGGSAVILTSGFLTTWGYASVFVYVAVVLVVAAGLMTCFGKQTSGRSLEKLGEPGAATFVAPGRDSGRLLQLGWT